MSLQKGRSGIKWIPDIIILTGHAFFRERGVKNMPHRYAFNMAIGRDDTKRLR